MQEYEPSILCTGPVEESILQAPEFAKSKIDVIPLTRISYDTTSAIARRTREILTEKATVVFTSNNAVRSVARFMKGFVPDWSIYCIGNTTYQLSVEYFGSSSIIATAPTASKLAEKIVPGFGHQSVIFFCGNLRRQELPAVLREKGIHVEEIIVYSTEITPIPIEKAYDAILFFSPSAATSFFQNNHMHPQTVSFVMGKTTEETIRRFGGNEVVTSKEPDKKLLIQSAIQHIIEKRKSADAGTNN